MRSPQSRRAVPRTDRVLADPALAQLRSEVHPDLLRSWVRAAQQSVRDGGLDPAGVPAAVLARAAPSLRRVVNATGVIVHTNLGRAPLSAAAVAAIGDAAGCTPIELDLGTGRRGPRAPEVLAALVSRVPAAEAALVVNNGAAAVLLAVTALAAGREVVISRGELVEIGDGFRLPELLATTGARLVEVGTTNRTTAADYARALTPRTGCVLKVHPSNFTVSGFVGTASVAELSHLEAPLVVDVGSGLLGPHPLLLGEPDVSSSLTAGADVVTCSGDKLLGGPQAGLLLGRGAVIEQARRHPLARALRPDKLTLAGLAATLRAPSTPVDEMLEMPVATLQARAQRLATTLKAAAPRAEAEISVGDVHSVIGGGGAPGVTVASVGVMLPAWCAPKLTAAEPPVLARVTDGRCVLDLRTVAPVDDDDLATAVVSVLRGG